MVAVRVQSGVRRWQHGLVPGRKVCRAVIGPELWTVSRRTLKTQ